MKVITVWNMKGGVGKTTLSFNLATNFAERGQKTLCIDLDPQANLTSYFESGKRVKGSKPDIAELAMTDFKDLDKGIYRSKYENLDFVFGCNSEVLIGSMEKLAKAIDAMADKGCEYTYCIIDCHPDFSMTTKNALYAADLVLVPISLDGFSRDNLNLVKNNLLKVEEEREILTGQEKELLYWVVSNRVANRRSQREVYKDIVTKHDYPFLDLCITESAAVQSANVIHKPVSQHRRFSAPAADLKELTEKVVELLEGVD